MGRPQAVYYRRIVGPIAQMLRSRLRPIAYRGAAVACPCCGGRWDRFVGGELGRCPRCDSKSRHRLLRIFLDGRAELIAGPLLHLAPEGCLENHLRRRLGDDYRTADLVRPDVDFPGLDLTDMPQIRSGTVRLVVCSHVLEHIPDDGAAMRELYRICAPNGVCLIQVPGGERPATDEDPTVTDPSERRRRFGKEDHVRRYGTDIAERLSGAGFEVDTAWVTDGMSRDAMHRNGLWRDCVYVCRRTV